MQDKDTLTRAQLIATVAEWSDFTGPLGLASQFSETTYGGPVWITRVTSADRTDGHACTIFEQASWNAFSAALTHRDRRELAYA